MTLPFLQGTNAPLAGPSDTEVSTLEDADNPVTYTPSALVDQWGLYWMVPEEGDESEAASEGAVGITGSLQTVQLSGLRNADFTTPPPFPDEYLDDTNPLPGWTFVRDVGGSIAATWVTDSAAPGGYAIRWEMSASASGDRAYFEQVAPVMPRAWPTTVAMARCEDSGSSVQFIEVQHLRYDGTVTGSSGEEGQYTAIPWGDAENLVAPVNVPDDARYVRFRFGVEAQASLSTTTSMREVYAGQPPVSYVTVAFCGTTLNPGGTQPLYSVSGNATGTPDNQVNRFIAPRPGWVVSLSVTGHQLLTSGSVDYRVRDDDSSSVIGPTATLDSASAIVGSGSRAWVTGEYDASDNRFDAGAILRGTADATAGVSNPGMDSLMHVTFAQVDI